MLYYSTNPNVKTVCQIREDKRSQKEIYYEFIEASGGSPNGCAEYRHKYLTLDAAREAAQECFLHQEERCENFSGSWHSERIFKVVVNGYGDEIQREQLSLFE